MMGEWTFFSNYGHVLVSLARNNQVRLRDVAVEVGITERAVQKIVKDLQDAGFLTVTKRGRCNRYQINKRKALRHSLESQCTVGKLLGTVASKNSRRAVSPVGPEPVESSMLVTAPVIPAKKQTKEVQAKQKKKKEKVPVDIREQGSLF